MIEIKNVTKSFKTNGERKYILENASFIIPEHKNIAILGRNGAGKSTLLRMLGGIDFPTSGTIKSNKSFSWPMGLKGGFQGSMTGRQNVKFVCRIYGKSEEEIAGIIDSVTNFAELGDYFDMPINIYSSGMKSRLSFGLSLAFDFDYLLIDETLSVGDSNFKQKSKIALQKKIETCNVLLVSHSMRIMREICDSGIVISNGNLEYYDNIEDAIKKYEEINGIMQNKLGKVVVCCDDGEKFDTLKEVAYFYNVRQHSISQALKQNNGSCMYLNKVFWIEGKEKPIFQKWKEIVEKETIISTDGIIFRNALEASIYYNKKTQKNKISELDIKNAIKTMVFTEINVKFYYLSEFK